MFNIYLMIELLKTADPTAAMVELKKLELKDCTFANVVALSDEKLVAQLDCVSADAGGRAAIERIATVNGIVQTNIFAVVRPKQ